MAIGIGDSVRLRVNSTQSRKRAGSVRPIPCELQACSSALEVQEFRLWRSTTSNAAPSSLFCAVENKASDLGDPQPAWARGCTKFAGGPSLSQKQHHSPAIWLTPHCEIALAAAVFE